MHVLKMLYVQCLSWGGSNLVFGLSLIASNLERQLSQRFLSLGTDSLPSAEDLIPIHCDLPSPDLIDVCATCLMEKSAPPWQVRQCRELFKNSGTSAIHWRALSDPSSWRDVL